MSTNEPESAQVIHNREASRFEIQIEGQVAVLTYRLMDHTITFTHTGVPKELEGQGLANRLAHAGLEYAREQGLKVQSRCSFVDVYLRRHKEYQHLLD